MGDWSVTQDGRPLATGPHQRLALHALVLTRGRMLRDRLADVIEPGTDLSPAARRRRQRAVRNVLSYLRTEVGLRISQRTNPVTMSPVQPQATIDLWDFFAHVDAGRWDDAHALIASGGEPWLFDHDDPVNEIWQHTLDEFADAKRRVLAARDSSAGRRHTLLDVRERLLARRLVPGVGRDVSVADMRQRLEPLAVPWRSLHPDEPWRSSPLPAALGELLAAPAWGNPRQIVVTGPPGAGKTLTAISTYLRLTDGIAELPVDAEPRTVLYADAHAEGAQPGFATDAWLDARLRGAGDSGAERPIVVMPHADAFLARPQHGLADVLGWRAFATCDVVLCCSDQLYFSRLRYEDYGTHVVRLGPWDRELQRAFALAISDERTCAAFEAWRDADVGGMRARLCTVPLHLVHILSLVADEPSALTGISQAHQLLDQVARMRLRVAGLGGQVEELLQELAALAHRFSIPAAPSDAPIGFSFEELREHVRARTPADAERRVEALVGSTLLAAPPAGSDELRFEEPSWGWFFVARHLVHTLSYRPQGALRAFSTLLSADVIELCEAMLREALPRHGEAIRASLRFALLVDEDSALSPGRRTVAREQVGYLLGMLGDASQRGELAVALDPERPEHERDQLVRRGIALGLADGGVPSVADRYVEALRAERAAATGAARGASLGFLLSSRGDQPFDPDEPGRIDPGVLPLRAVADLLDELEDDTRADSWRIKLFTLVDFGEHPAIGARELEEALTTQRERLQAISDRLARDSDRHDWPELAELRRLLDPSALPRSRPAAASSG